MEAVQLTDWSKIKIHCSSMGKLFTEPKLKADKDAGNLSQTAKSHLIKIYIEERWNRRKRLLTKHMEKGLLAEENLFTLLSVTDKKFYTKNTEQKFNEWIIGFADIVEDGEDGLVIDGKASWEPETFMPKLIEKLDPDYEMQLQCYMWLWNKKRARLSYGLVNTPDHLIESERRKLLWNMNVATEESPEFKEAEAELLKNCIFDDIPKEQRVIHHYIDLDENFIAAIPAKVEKAREFLEWFERLHLGYKM